MERVSLPDLRPWGRGSLTIPPTSRQAWVRLAVWELWMGALVCTVVVLGVWLIRAAPDRIIAVSDLANCYAPPPVPLPCERIVYRGGALNALFTALCGLMFVGVAAWFLWELWSAAEPKPITDDFLKLLHQSFGRDWRNPLTWPWARLLWAYGFTLLGATVTAGAAVLIWTLVAAPDQDGPPAVHIETSQSFRLGE